MALLPNARRLESLAVKMAFAHDGHEHRLDFSTMSWLISWPIACLCLRVKRCSGPAAKLEGQKLQNHSIQASGLEDVGGVKEPAVAATKA